MRFRPIGVAAAGVLALAWWGCATTVVKPIPLPPLSAVEVAPDTATLRMGETVDFSGSAFDTLGALVGGATFEWMSLDPTIFTVDGSGRARGVSEGVALLVIEAGGLRDTASVTVVPQVDGWFTQASNANGANLRGIFFQPNGRDGWAVGDGGKIVVTHNAGASWSAQVSRTTFSLHAAWFTGALEGWAVGAAGTIVHTIDGGVNWTRVLSGASETLMDVHFATRDTGWVVGSNGVTLRTFDRGASWTKRYPTPNTLRSVSFAGTLDGWAVGDGVIVGTHDRGLSWFVVQPSVTALSMRGVWRRSEPLAVAVGSQGVAPRTVTGPDSTKWTLLNAGATYQLEGVHFPTDLIGFAVGFSGTGTVLRSGDGGATWQAQTSNTQFPLNDVFFVDDQRGWAVGETGTILHTATGGTQ